MATYSTLSYGSTGDDVKSLQTALNNAGYRSGTVDGIFGSNTQSALNAYKKANGLTEDGIADDSTLGKLYGTGLETSTSTTTTTTNPSVSNFSSYQYDTSTNDAYNQAVAKLAAQGDRPTFSYDVNSDPVYDALKTLYTSQGKQAMQDTIGQASSLTGGYSNTYAQNAGQQAYDNYLQQLNGYIPDLYDSAYNRYQQDVTDWENDRSYLTNERDTAYSNGYNNWYNALDTGLSAQENAYDNLVTLIGNTGYSPSEQELANAGMTQAEADAWLNYYTANNTSSSGGSGSGGGTTTTTSNDTGTTTQSARYPGAEAYIKSVIAQGNETQAAQYLANQKAYGTLTDNEIATLATKYGIAT